VVPAERFAPYVEAVCREIREHRELYEAVGIGSGLEKADGAERMLLDSLLSRLRD
jgi:hypothetical protein